MRCSDTRIKARLHDGPGGTYLWVANPTHQPLPVQLDLSEKWGLFQQVQALWGASADLNGCTLTLHRSSPKYVCAKAGLTWLAFYNNFEPNGEHPMTSSDVLHSAILTDSGDWFDRPMRWAQFDSGRK